jgi:hypothetical protein
LKKDKAKKNKKLSAAILILKLINIFKLSGAIGQIRIAGEDI